MAIASLKISNEVKPSKSKAKTVRKPSKSKPYTTNELVRVGGFAGVALCGLCVSLPHLAHEVTTLTGANEFAGWFLAIVIDVGMIVTKAHLSCRGRNEIIPWSVVGACTAVSIVLNSHAFYAHATTSFGQWAAIGFGIFLPLFILAQSYLASEILNRK